MSIISKETFEKFTEKEKEKIRYNYNELRMGLTPELGDDLLAEQIRKIKEFEDLFGEENLQPKPKIKTWKDLEEAEDGEISVNSNVYHPYDREWDTAIKYHIKAQATLKLAILIERGYGGVVTSDEWEKEINDGGGFYTIKWCPFYRSFHIDFENNYECFIAFHTRKQAEEFMHYSDNVNLLRQYNMI